MAGVAVDRSQALAYRVAAHELDRSVADPAELAVFDLGVQQTPGDAARLAVDARLPETPAPDPTEDGDFTLAWSHRGAPHLHRSKDIRSVATAGWPRSDADAAARLGWQRAQLNRIGMAAISAYREVAEAVRDAAAEPITKGALSAAVTGRISPGLSAFCRGCDAVHVYEQLLRLVALPAGLALEYDSSPPTLLPIKRWPGIPTKSTGVAKVIEAYLRLHGPATVVEVAGFLGTSKAEIEPNWPGKRLVEVEVDGKPGSLPEDRLDALKVAEQAELVRLLPPLDPYLQARDRDLFVPDKAHQKELWRVLGNPGAIMVDGEIAGSWRPRKNGRKLELSVKAFRRLSADDRSRLAAEAERVAAARGADEVSLKIAG